MTLSNISIRTILAIITGVMGLFALFLALLSGDIHRDLVLNNQKNMMQDMISIAANERIKDLNQVSRDLGLALQSEKSFQLALKSKNKPKLISLLNNQFDQYFVTAGIIQLEQLVLFDNNISLIAESSKGAVFFEQKSKLKCSNLENRMRSRKGIQRMTVLNDLCLYEDKPINVVIVPVGGLRLKGYVAVVSNPTHNLTTLESNLGMPVKLLLNIERGIIQSSGWPDNISNYLVSSFPLENSSGLHILSILTAQNIGELAGKLQSTRLEVLLYAGLGTIVVLGLCVFIIRRTMLVPLIKLTDKLCHFNLAEAEKAEQLEIQGTKEIQSICAGFNSMSKSQHDSQKADYLKSQFLANMSHEIRTPLTAIIGFSESLYQNEKSKDTKSSLERIIRNGKHLHQLINDILDLSKIEANQLTIESIKVAVPSLMFEIDSLMAEKATNKGLKFNVLFNYPLPEFIISDPTRLKQILINLCSNAIKFTDAGKVELKVFYVEENNSLHFSVQDNGIGMNDKQIDGLFTPFKQADDSTTRKYGGTGLGLYISKLLSEKLGGDITVSSREDVGSLFEVSITAGDFGKNWVYSEKDILSTPNTSKVLIPRLSGNILLAEDNVDNQHLISFFIEKTGASVDVADNGKVAVEKALQGEYELILMDMQMPVMGGIEAIKKIREANCTTPVAMLTANAMKEDIQKSEEAGANSFLTKPINQNTFYATLLQYLHVIS